MTSMFRLSLAVLGCATALAFAAPANAEMMNFKANIDAKSEVPPANSKGSGSMTATYDTASKKLSWKGSYKDLSGPATAAHLHGPAEPGKNAGVMVPVSPATSPFEGSATLNDDQSKALMAGQLYINFHTAENKGGEIRGQLTK